MIPKGIANHTGSRSKNTTLLLLAVTQLTDTTNWRQGWTEREERHGTRNRSTAGQLSEGGGGVDNDIVDINENYVNNINSNTELVNKVDGLAVEDTGTT